MTPLLFSFLSFFFLLWMNLLSFMYYDLTHCGLLFIKTSPVSSSFANSVLLILLPGRLITPGVAVREGVGNSADILTASDRRICDSCRIVTAI